MIVVALNLVDAAKPQSAPHRQGRRYKRQKPLTKHTMTLATRGWLLIYYSPHDTLS
jgi:hypothetical protein